MLYFIAKGHHNMEDVPLHLEDGFRRDMETITQACRHIERDPNGFDIHERVEVFKSLIQDLPADKASVVARDLAHILNQWWARLEDRDQLLRLAADTEIPKKQLANTLANRGANRAVIIDMAIEVKRRNKRPRKASLLHT